MVDETPRLNLDRFEQGDTDWDHTDTVEAVDETAIARGPIEDRPAEGSYDDELYHSTDQRITWRWDSEEEDWKAASGLGSEDQPVPGTTHLESASVEEARITGDGDISINVPSDFSTLADAILAATEVVKPKDGVQVVVNIESGHVIETDPGLSDGDYGYITLTSEDSTVPIDNIESGNLFSFNDCRAPYWDVLIDMEGQANRGIEMQNSSIRIADDKGIINASEMGLRASSSNVRANNANFSGAGAQAMQLTGASTGMLQNADLSNSGATNNGALYVSRASCAAIQGSDLSNSNTNGIYVRRSVVHAGSVDVSGASGDGINARNMSLVAAGDLTAQNLGSAGVECRTGSRVSCRNATISGTGWHGVVVREGGHVICDGANISDSDNRLIDCRYGSKITAFECTLDNASDDAVAMFGGARGSIRDSEINNAESWAVYMLDGSVLTANGVVVDGNEIVDSDVNAPDFNTVEERGIIFGPAQS